MENLITTQKRALRKELRKKLASEERGIRLERSSGLASHLVAWLRFQPEVKKVALFSALPSEVDLSMAMVLMPTIEWFYPMVSGKGLSFHRVSEPGTLRSGFKGVLEPNPQIHPPVIKESLDLVVCPGLGFTAQGARLGRGGGFYDRFLESVPKVLSLGVCTPLQFLEELPQHEHDVNVTHLLSMEGVREVLS